jgi:3-keto-disaccharide hydrolase
MTRKSAIWASLVLAGLLSGSYASGQRNQVEHGWTQLWNGKNLDGWTHVGPGIFVVENGMLKAEGGRGVLWYTRRKFGNCVIRVIYKTAKKSDTSGVFIRIPEKPSEPAMPMNKGYDVRIDDSGGDYSASGVLYSMTKAMVRPGKTGEWNTMDIAIEGPRTIVLLNGVQVTDYTEGQPVPKKEKSDDPQRGPRPNAGYIGLENHSDKDTVYFGEIAERGLGQ